MNRSALCVTTALVLALALSAPLAAGRAAATTRTIYFSVVDGKGVPVAGITAADVTVKENGKDYPVEKLEAATGPIQLSIIVDDNGTGAFRAAVGSFVQSLLGKAEFQIVTVMQQVRRLTDFTTDVEALRTALTGAGLGQRSGAADGNFLADGILSAGKDLEKRSATRPAIVVISAAGTDRSNAQSGDILKQLKTTMATFNVISLSNAMVTDAGSGGSLGGLMAEVDTNRALDDGPKQAGGKRYGVQRVADVAAVLKVVADQLAGQYALTYTVPDGVKLNEKLQIQVKRGGTTVLAPTKINDK